MHNPSLQWKTSPLPIDYEYALMEMELHVNRMRTENAPGLIWLLEHPPLYTSGTNSKEEEDLRISASHLPFSLYPTGRGGRVTYHGPGQRIIYCMLDLNKNFQEPDIKKYISTLETWIINTLKDLGVDSFRQEGLIGIWTHGPNQSIKKIAAIGVRVRHWITFHGISLNVCPDLTHYDPIIPCGVDHYGITSLKALGIDAPYIEIDKLLEKNCPFNSEGL